MTMRVKFQVDSFLSCFLNTDSFKDNTTVPVFKRKKENESFKKELGWLQTHQIVGTAHVIIVEGKDEVARRQLFVSAHLKMRNATNMKHKIE